MGSASVTQNAGGASHGPWKAATMDTMTDNAQRNMPVTAPPVPLLTGNAFTADDGTTKRVQSATVTLTADDGTTKTMELEWRFGGWWAPAP